MKLDAIGISYYRSIGEELLWLDLSKKINIVIGANNSGKSNFLSAIKYAYEKNLPSLTDYHNRNKESPPKIHLKASFTKQENVHNIFLDSSITAKFVVEGNKLTLNELPEFIAKHDPKIQDLSEQLLKKRFENFSPRSAGYEEALRAVRQHISQTLIEQFPKVFLIPQFRKIEKGDVYSVEGAGIAKKLAEWQRPEIGNEDAENKFLRIQELLRNLLHRPEIELRISYPSLTIQVKDGNFSLPLDSFGTGVHQLIILAIAITSQDNTLICIEEPENHFHPKLQKEFLRFLKTDESNTFLISTHSNVMISPSEDVNIIHVGLYDGTTIGTQVKTTKESLRILHDLGVKASDILQCNFVIWVEGPSDRIYLNKWISLADPTLAEGFDYQIMFYGGRLLNHLSLENDTLPHPDDLITLLRINHNAAIIIDSDRKQASDHINETKERVRNECVSSDILCWITEGREIENYLLGSEVSATYHKLTNINLAITIGQYEKIDTIIEKKYLPQSMLKKWLYGDAKAEIAREIVKNIASLDNAPHDLKEKIYELVKKIKHASSLSN